MTYIMNHKVPDKQGHADNLHNMILTPHLQYIDK